MKSTIATEHNIDNARNPEARRLADAYLKSLETRRYSKRSLDTYAYALTRFIKHLDACGAPRLNDVSQQDLARYRAHLIDREYAPATVHLFVRAVRGLFNWLEDNRHIFLNPAVGLAVPAPERRLLPVPSEEDLERLLNAPDTSRPAGIRNRALMEVGYGCALRREELAGLKKTDAELDRRLLRVMGKGSRERMVPLGGHAGEWLEKYIHDARSKLLGDRTDGGHLWVSRRSGRLSGQGIHVMLKKYGREADIEVPITPHALRRACATHMLNRGAHPVEIQLLLGHASLRHLGCYLRVGIREMKAIHARSNPGR